MCESKLVGLKGCSADVPVTNLYIDQLGITEGFLSNLITSQYDTPKELFDDKLGLAWQKIKTQFLASLTEFIAGDTVIDNRKVGQRLHIAELSTYRGQVRRHQANYSAANHFIFEGNYFEYSASH
jgi:hypothetical protein